MSQRAGGIDALMLLMEHAKERLNRENLTPEQRQARVRELSSAGANLAMMLMEHGGALEATVETEEHREAEAAAEAAAEAEGATTLASLGNRFEEAVNKACEAEQGDNEREFDDALRALRSLITTDPKLVNRQGSFNVTALHTAMATASPQVVKTLLTFKAEETKPDTRLLNCFDQTPLMRLRRVARTKPKAKECIELMLKYNREAGMVDASCPDDVDAILAAPKRKSPEPKDEDDDDANPLKKKKDKNEFEAGDSRECTLQLSTGPKEKKEVKDEPKEVKDEPKEVKDEPKD